VPEYVLHTGWVLVGLLVYGSVVYAILPVLITGYLSYPSATSRRSSVLIVLLNHSRVKSDDNKKISWGA